MANRSKKAVISARIDPYLKAGLELAATSQKEKIVALLEYGIRGVLGTILVEDPFGEGSEKQTSFALFFNNVWSEDEVVYKMRLGYLGEKFADKVDADMATLVVKDDYFKGDFDLFGDLNGNAKEMGLVPPTVLINLDLVRAEWDTIFGYVLFVHRNRGLLSNYHDFKKMVENSRSQ